MNLFIKLFLLRLYFILIFKLSKISYPIIVVNNFISLKYYCLFMNRTKPTTQHLNYSPFKLGHKNGITNKSQLNKRYG